MIARPRTGAIDLDRKFWTDTVWSYGSLAVIAGAGLAINLLVAAFRGAEALGVFNQIYAIYVIAAQFAVMAVHDSAQKHAAEYIGENEDECRDLATAAVVQALISGTVVATIVLVGAPLLGRLLDSPAVGTGIAFAAPGLLFFSVNKVMLGILNGRREMRAYCIGQSLRGVGILGLCVAVIALDWDAAWLGASFTFAEILLLPFLIKTALPRPFQWQGSKAVRAWMKRHANFGTKAFINGLLAEAYIRVDVLMLGVFLNDKQVGIYSFAAMFIEGLFQVSIVIRTLANPMLVKLLQAKDKPALARFARRVGGISLAATAVVALALYIVFPYLDPFFPGGMVLEARGVLTVLAVGMTIFALFVPVDHVLLQAGRPGAQSVVMTANVSVNAALNALLIPLYGLMGAAFATAIAFFAAGMILNLAAWRILGLRGGILIAK